MKYYNVKFTFDIPVAVRDDETDIDAYYAARKAFGDYSINEATPKIELIDEAKYDKDVAVVNKLHADMEKHD